MIAAWLTANAPIRIKERYAEHDSHHDPSWKRIACHEQDDSNYNCRIENKSCHAIGVKPCAAYIPVPEGIDNMEHHGYHDEQHTEGNGNDEHGVQLAQERKRGHMVDRPDPQRRDHIFESEDTSEKESKYSGKESCC